MVKIRSDWPCEETSLAAGQSGPEWARDSSREAATEWTGEEAAWSGVTVMDRSQEGQGIFRR